MEECCDSNSRKGGLGVLHRSLPTQSTPQTPGGGLGKGECEVKGGRELTLCPLSCSLMWQARWGSVRQGEPQVPASSRVQK